jgi:hypothetical protein
MQIRKLEQKLERIEEERRGLEVAIHIPDGEQGNRVKDLESQMDNILKERVALEEGMRYGAEGGLRDEVSQKYEEDLLKMRRRYTLALTGFLFVLVVLYLPTWFRFVASGGDHHGVAPTTESTSHEHGAGEADPAHAHDAAGGSMMSGTKVRDAIKTIDSGAVVQDESVPHSH